MASPIPPESTTNEFFLEGDTLEILCFPDGNLSLQADIITVKVHSGVMSLHSTVFNRIWEGRPIKENGTVGIRLPNIMDEDLIRYTNAVYNINDDHERPDALKVSSATSLLRTSLLFEHALLYTKLKSRIFADFPFTLVTWDNAYFGNERLLSGHGGEFDLVNAIDLCRLSRALPALLFKIATIYSSVSN
ncbi:hypothetical protein DXG01_012986 [Tephrocybe rancida]|nr:hypothetical protein DXG01_012986 [Tephrocybe rancida]